MSTISQRLPRNDRGLIVNWLIKLIIGFALLAIVIYDGGSIVINFFTLDSKADEIAVQLTTNIGPNDLVESTLRAEALTLAKDAGARLVDLRVEGNIVFVTLRRRADTMVIGRIGLIKDWTRATAEGQSGAG
jgi:hypothetical protein